MGRTNMLCFRCVRKWNRAVDEALKYIIRLLRKHLNGSDHFTNESLLDFISQTKAQ
jgi:hypothetical protein